MAGDRRGRTGDPEDGRTVDRTGGRSTGGAEQLGWLAAAGLLAFAVPAVFSGLLGLGREPYLLIYLPAAGVFTAVYLARAAPGEWIDPRGEWVRATLVGLVAGALLVVSVLRGPAGGHASGPAFLVDLVWPGVAYGVVDALLLTVLPVAAVHGALEKRPRHRRETLAAAGLALAASLAITAVYHLGYEEFRGAALAGPLVGNAVVTLAYLAVRSPVAPVLAHAAMHVAAVVHGMEAAVQLPPHG